MSKRSFSNLSPQRVFDLTPSLNKGRGIKGVRLIRIIIKGDFRL